MDKTIRTWSFSRLAVFETCPYRAKLAYIDRIPEPERPLPKGKTEHANDRGSRIHASAEAYIKGDVEEVIPELKDFAAEIKQLRDMYAQGKVSLEGEWGIDKDWTPVPWDDKSVWGRVKLDALVHINKHHAIVVDYKTGRKFGNEFKHGEQCQLYQLATFMRYPELEIVETELWYTDQDELTHMRYTRDQGLRFFANINSRATKMTTATEFTPKPSPHACRYCPYSEERGNGVCEYSV